MPISNVTKPSDFFIDGSIFSVSINQSTPTNSASTNPIRTAIPTVLTETLVCVRIYIATDKLSNNIDNEPAEAKTFSGFS